MLLLRQEENVAASEFVLNFQWSRNGRQGAGSAIEPSPFSLPPKSAPAYIHHTQGLGTIKIPAAREAYSQSFCGIHGCANYSERERGGLCHS